MKIYLIVAVTALTFTGNICAQEKTGKTVENEKKSITIVSAETQAARARQDAHYAKEQKKLQKKENRIAKKQAKFEKQQGNLAKAQSKFDKEREKRDSYQSKINKQSAKYNNRLSQGKLSAEDTAKWDSKRAKLQKVLDKSSQRMEKADEKVRKLRR